jgi:hypothetical protein
LLGSEVCGSVELGRRWGERKKEYSCDLVSVYLLCNEACSCLHFEARVVVETTCLCLWLVLLRFGVWFVQKMECFDMCFPRHPRASHIIAHQTATTHDDTLFTLTTHEFENEIIVNCTSLLLIIGAASSICSFPPLVVTGHAHRHFFFHCLQTIMVSRTSLACREATVHNELPPSQVIILPHVISLERECVVLNSRARACLSSGPCVCCVITSSSKNC